MAGEKTCFKIGILSDTHIRRFAFSLPPRLSEAFEGVDMILHAGDIQIDEVLMELTEFAPVYAVAGNCDGWDIAHAYGRKRVLNVLGRKIGLIHGSGRGPEAWRRAYMEFDDTMDLLHPKLDCLVFGHTHVPEIKEVNGMLIINPGSATDRRGQPHHTAAILEIFEDRMNGYIINIDE